MLAALPVVGLIFDGPPRPMLDSPRVEPVKADAITFPEASPTWGRVVAFSDMKRVPAVPDGTLYFDLSARKLYVWNAERAEWLERII